MPFLWILFLFSGPHLSAILAPPSRICPFFYLRTLLSAFQPHSLGFSSLLPSTLLAPRLMLIFLCLSPRCRLFFSVSA
ncbi:hypothetical protein BJ165DRAFT_1519269 [Panaeolus papilionaceus]|nr:hypothetical protein BJ165DRAFT_1519269 [Panaeolus papilionaceus]